MGSLFQDNGDGIDHVSRHRAKVRLLRLQYSLDRGIIRDLEHDVRGWCNMLGFHERDLRESVAADRESGG